MASSQPLSDEYERDGLTPETFLTHAAGSSDETSQDIEAAPKQSPESSCDAPGEAKMISTQMVAWAILLGFSTGTVFGIALEKSKVYTPIAMRRQFMFSNYLMLNVFLAATCVGLLFIRLMEAIELRKRSIKGPVALGFGVMFGYGGTITGGIVLGFGMAISGTCPGTIFAQIGAGTPDALYSFLGGVVGAIIFGVVAPMIKKRSNGKFMASRGKHSLDSAFHHKLSHTTIMLIVFLACAGVIAIINLRDWREDAQQTVQNDVLSVPNFSLKMSDAVWNPALAGILLGLLQIPTFIGVHKGLGASSSFVTLAAWLVSAVDRQWRDHAPYLIKFHYGFGVFWSVCLVAGTVFGAYVSSTKGNVVLVTDGDIAYHHPAVNFAGGLLMLWGARLAGGCTSGHGITGIAQLSTASIVAVGAMFLGGTVMSFILFHGDR
jgi:uncharacterized membrane protein YedE/YeeE